MMAGFTYHPQSMTANTLLIFKILDSLNDTFTIWAAMVPNDSVIATPHPDFGCRVIQLLMLSSLSIRAW
jgi:hypothetical protein